jgi:ABC-2 type transport system ATP-binding protein
MDESAVIQVERLTRRYGGRPGYEAVRGVDFAVRRGELFALLGTNGAGKTSTLEVLEGLAQPTSGTVRVLGHDPYRDRRIVRPRIGIMLQDRGFAADLTVAETTKMWTGTLSTPRPVGEILELVELTSRAGVRVRQLSGGERQRLSLGLAIAGQPDLLFLDEPTCRRTGRHARLLGHHASAAPESARHSRLLDHWRVLVPLARNVTPAVQNPATERRSFGR